MKSKMKEVKCPKCGSTQFAAKKRGFGIGKALAGAFVAGPVGLAAGILGSNKTVVVCLVCGCEWKPGK